MNFQERKDDFLEWHRANPEVWKLFEKFTFEAINRGHKRLSHWLVVQRIRWETTVVTHGDDFKISNDRIGFYARLFMRKYPQHVGFFDIRIMEGEPHDAPYFAKKE
ncbi:MAG TPA: hypothetical protein VF681_14655 [Abditibacteriaceae bacterium]|jgi:hypothetical protein